MKKTVLHKVINLMLLLVMLSHLSYFHQLLETYVVCYGSDGHIEIENIEDNSSCSSSGLNQTKTHITSVMFESNDCDDVKLGEQCIEDLPYLVGNKLNFIQILPFSAITEFNNRKRKPFSYSVYKNTEVNKILDIRYNSHSDINLLVDDFNEFKVSIKKAFSIASSEITLLRSVQHSETR